MLPALASVWHELMDHDDVAHVAVLSGLKASTVIDEALDQHPEADLLPLKSLEDFVENCWLYAKCQNACADHFNTKVGLMVFDVTIKTHWMLHAALDAHLLDPRRDWNYCGEHFMNVGKVFMQTCAKGNSGSKSMNTLIEKYSY